MFTPQHYTYIYFDDFIPFYVGKGQKKIKKNGQLYDRAKNHLGRKDRHPVTHKIQKMLREGTEPLIKIINVNNKNEAFELEKFLISEIGRKDLGTGSLLNMTDGGEGDAGLAGKPKSEKHKEAMRLAWKKRKNKEPWNKGKNNSMYGKVSWNKVTDTFVFMCEQCGTKKDLLTGTAFQGVSRIQRGILCKTI